MPTLSEEYNELLGMEITAEEVSSVITQALMGKAQGSDGFMTLNNKTFASLLAPP